jgi:D-3-phosphoglycerate dehydrogenase / 2-oxoglutarate reductase
MRRHVDRASEQCGPDGAMRPSAESEARRGDASPGEQGAAQPARASSNGRMKLLIASPIDSEALDTLARAHDVQQIVDATESTLAAALDDRDVLVFRSGVTISADVLGSGSRLRLLVRAGSGLDNVDVAAAHERAIRVVRIPGFSADAVAEFTFALMLGLARNVALADRLLRQGRWPKRDLGGPLLRGKTLGIVGAGKIGTRVAQLGAAWGMDVVGCVAEPDEPAAVARVVKDVTLTSFDAVVASADFLCLHVPLSDSTHYLVNADVLARMKPGSFLINVARGGVVDEEALYHALTDGGNLAGAALDVHEQEGEGTISRFAELPNVVLSPHIGAMAIDVQREIGRRLIELVDAFGAGRLDEETHDGELVL